LATPPRAAKEDRINFCGRSTYKLMWEEIVALYRLTLVEAPPHNLRPRYNVCPTTTIDTIVSQWMLHPSHVHRLQG